MTAQNDKASLQSQINKHQHKLKSMNDDFKSRLNKYLKDIAVNSILPLRHCFEQHFILNTLRLIHGLTVIDCNNVLGRQWDGHGPAHGPALVCVCHWAECL